MATFTKLPLSISNYGKQILITAASSASANPIHTSVTGTSDFDEVYLYAYNECSTSLSCSILWGGTKEPNDVVRSVIPSKSGRTLIVDGKLLQNNLTIYGYAQAANWITIDGFVNRITSNLNPTPIDPLVTSWVNRIVINGGATPSLNTQNALTIFLQSLYRYNLYQKMIVVNPFVPDSLSASLVPLVRGAGYDMWANHNFTGSDLTINGLKGDASSRYLDTGVNPFYSYTSINNCGITEYAYSASTAVATDVGIYHSDNNQLFTMTPNYTGLGVSDAFGQNSLQVNVAYPGPGYFSANRDSSTSLKVYYANSTTAHNQVGSTQTGNNSAGHLPSGSVPIFNILLLHLGTYANYSPNILSFVAIHTSLTQAESNLFFSAIQTLRQSLGGGYV